MRQALAGARELQAVVNFLTEREVMAALEHEHATQRRPVLIDRLIRRAMKLKRQELEQRYQV